MFTGFWVEAPFLEAEKEDSNCEVKVLAAKKQMFAHFLAEKENQLLQFSKSSSQFVLEKHILILKQVCLGGKRVMIEEYSFSSQILGSPTVLYKV